MYNLFLKRKKKKKHTLKHVTRLSLVGRETQPYAMAPIRVTSAPSSMAPRKGSKNDIKSSEGLDVYFFQKRD
jgi:hypothetical protein